MNKKNAKKKIFIIVAILVFFIGIIIGIAIKHKNINKKIEPETNTKQSVQDKIKKDTIDANSDDVKELYTEDYKKYLELTDEEKNEIEVVPRKYSVKYDELDRIFEKEAKNKNSKNNELRNNKNTKDNTEKNNKQTENSNEKTSENPVEDKYDNGEKKLERDVPQENQKENETKTDPTKEDEKQNQEVKDLPSHYDLREHINLKVKDQINEGRCWIFAALECVETNLALTQGKYYDFSEVHVDYLTSNLLSKNYRTPGSGGNFDMFVDYYINYQDGFVDENKLFYSGDYSGCGEALLNMERINESVYDVVAFPEYKPNESAWTDKQFKEYQDLIKYHIMNYGSLYAGVYAFPNESYPNVYFKNADENNSKDGHAISIIGWDDNYSRNNFKSPTGNVPEKDGAYIFLNSWGEDYGENGYGYISYCDYMVHNNLNGVVSTNKKDVINVESLSQAAQKYIYKELNNNLIDNKYIKKSVLEAVRVIDLSNQNLTQIQGLDVFPNLNDLNISNNKITDISNLSTLKNLNFIDFSGNKDITGWKNLTNVYSITARNCNIKDLSGIENIKELTYLDLSENKELVNLQLINQVTNLDSLVLENCDLNDISFLNNQNIITLDISDNKNISNYSVLFSNCTNIQELKIKNNGITDISKLNLSDLNLYGLDLSYNTGLSNFDKLPKVSKLVLSNCNLGNVESLKEMDSINELDISYNNINDISPLNNLINLYNLNVEGNTNISGNLKDTQINELNINNCNLNNDFDYFGINSLYSISCKNNNIDLNEVDSKNQDLYKIILDECSYEDYYNLINRKNIFIENSTIYNTVKIPSGNVRIFINEANKYISKKDYIKNLKSNYIDVELYENTQLEINDYTNYEDKIFNCKYIYCFEIDNNIVPVGLQIKQLPNKVNFSQDEEFDFEGLKVSLVYGNNKILNETNEYNTNLPKDMIYGLYNVKVYKDNLEAYFPIFYEKQIELQFDSNKVYNYIYTQLQEHNQKGNDIIKDDSKMSIIVNGEIYKKILSEVSIDVNTLLNMDPIENIEIKSVMIKDYAGDTNEIDREKIVQVFPYVTFAYSNYNNEDTVLISNGEFIYKDNTEINDLSETLSLNYEELENYINHNTEVVKTVFIEDYNGNIDDIDVERITEIFKNAEHVIIYDNGTNEDIDLLNQVQNNPKEIIEENSIQLEYKKIDEYNKYNTDNVYTIEITDYNEVEDIDINKIESIFKNVKLVIAYDNSKNEDVILLNKNN